MPSSDLGLGDMSPTVGVVGRLVGWQCSGGCGQRKNAMVSSVLRIPGFGWELLSGIEDRTQEGGHDGI